ncbi:alpha/beta hydrolase [Williamsia sp.]|uniref:alpha/beta hydrolase n=1 Tax=Williamsia sp. TaxID=1872085 RepID=UPI0039C9B1C1
MGTYVDQATNLQATAGEVLYGAGRGNQTTATIAWIGYDAPAAVNEATYGTDAKRARGDLADFLDVVNQSRADNRGARWTWWC